MPVIAALNGHFIGGGAELAFSADFRFATPEAKCKIPAAAIGVHYEPSGIERVINVVGKQMSKRLFLGLESFRGSELLEHHFVDALCDDPLSMAQEYAENICALAPLAIEGMKLSIHDPSEETNARKRIARCFASEDFKEAMDAIHEKRNPEFIGR